MTGLAPEFDLLRTDWPLFVATDAPVVRKLNVTAPYDGAAIAQVAVAGERHVQDALFAAFAMFRQQDRRLSRSRRAAVLQQAELMVHENAAVFASEAARESGKPLAACVAEVQEVLECARTARKLLEDSAVTLSEAVADGSLIDADGSFIDADGSFIAADGSSTVEQHAEPLGVVVAIIGTHSPLRVAAEQLFAAVAAGVPIIIKPAQHAPLSCLRLVQLLHEAGMPYVWVQGLVPETHELVQQLATDPRVALVSFTGSATIGWQLRSQLPPGTRCVLDHGSVAPAIVADDADRTHAIDAIITAAFLTQGGRGEALQRVFVPVAYAAKFAADLAQRCQTLKVGDPLKSDTDVGAMTRSSDVDRLSRWVSEAVAGGATVLTPDKSEQESSGCFYPTVIFDPPIGASISNQPAGGPLLAVYGVANLDAACERANALPFARSALVFTQSKSTAARLCRALDASRVVVNGGLKAMPDGTGDAGAGQQSVADSANGLRRSGLGASGILARTRAMQINKVIVWPIADQSNQPH